MKKMALAAVLALVLVGSVWADLTITSNVVGFDAIVVVRDPLKPNDVDDRVVVLKLNESKSFQTFGRDMRVYVYDRQTRLLMCSGTGPANGRVTIETDGAKWKLR